MASGGKGKTGKRVTGKKLSAPPAGKKTAAAVKPSKTRKKPGAAKPLPGPKGPVKGRGKHSAEKLRVPLAPAQKAGKKVKRDSGKASQERLDSLRKVLQERKEKILKEARNEIAKYLSGENRQLVDTALDDGDWAVVDINEDISLRMLSSHRSTLHDIDEAIRKIKEGTYGICEECGEEISAKRLSILPAAVLCIDCKEHRERFASLHSDESL